jgi:hypothetical protein
MDKRDWNKCMELHKRLKNKIKGGIFISISNGTLTVHINAHRGIKYTRYINDLDYRINIDKLVDEIEYDYRKYIKSKFLYEEGGIL